MGLGSGALALLGIRNCFLIILVIIIHYFYFISLIICRLVNCFMIAVLPQ